MASAGDDLAPLKKALGDLLAARRAAAGLTQLQLARAISYGRTTVATAESGHRQPAAEFWTGCDEILAAGGDLTRAYGQLAAARRHLVDQRVQAGRSRRAGQPDSDLAVTAGSTKAVSTVRASDPDARQWAFVSPGPVRPPVPALKDLSAVGAAVLLAPVRAAMTAYHRDGSPMRDPRVEHRVAAEAHRRYQNADYAGSAQLLPGLLTGLETRQTTSRPALVSAGVSYLAASKLAVKAGDAQLAWLSADRAAARAALAEDPALHAAAVYQVACAFLADRRPEDTERLAVQAADSLGHAADRSTRTLSVRGALFLLAAVAAAHTSRPADSTDYLLAAAHLAAQLGRDDNQLWTGFGPTNVTIHRLSVAVALGQPDQALTLGAGLDTTTLPAGLTGRRCQVHLDLAHARAEQHDDPIAVLHLLEAERVAPQAMQANAAAQHTLTNLLRREHRELTPGLRPLAQRAGLAA